MHYSVSSVMHYGGYISYSVSSVMHYGGYISYTVTSVMHYGIIFTITEPLRRLRPAHIYAWCARILKATSKSFDIIIDSI